jgi:hypothetical protein
MGPWILNWISTRVTALHMDRIAEMVGWAPPTIVLLLSGVNEFAGEWFHRTTPAQDKHKNHSVYLLSKIC